MPKYQEISTEGKVTKFNVICEDGYEEEQTYECLEGETKKEMMSRIAWHLEETRATAGLTLKMTPPIPMAPVEQPPIVDALPKA